MSDRILLEDSWKNQLVDEFSKPYMQALRSFLKQEKKRGKVIYPKSADIFNAFEYTPFDAVKVVILGQDPYHGPNQAHGLCFSVPPKVALPPSLQNIYKEIERDCDIRMPKHGCLESWAKQGVLLLNSVLTVEARQAASHQKRGWEEFTDQVIHRINDNRNNIAFVLWGSYAQRKGAFIDQERHLVLRSVHPSPLSAHRGFLGCGHFSKINDYLRQVAKAPIDWSLPAVASSEAV